MRKLTAGERRLATVVFGDSIRLDRVRIGRAAVGPFAITLGPRILFPGSPPQDFAAASPDQRAWFVHELTHVWQFQTAPGRTLASWARTVATGGYGPGLPGYAYRHPFEWAALNLEQQASAVEHAYRLREQGRLLDLARYAGRTPFEALTRTA